VTGQTRAPVGSADGRSALWLSRVEGWGCFGLLGVGAWLAGVFLPGQDVAAQQGPAEDGARGEDASGPPERGGVAVYQREAGQAGAGAPAVQGAGGQVPVTTDPSAPLQRPVS